MANFYNNRATEQSHYSGVIETSTRKPQREFNNVLSGGVYSTGYIPQQPRNYMNINNNINQNLARNPSQEVWDRVSDYYMNPLYYVGNVGQGRGQMQGQSNNVNSFVNPIIFNTTSNVEFFDQFKLMVKGIQQEELELLYQISRFIDNFRNDKRR
jgi:hypothetical protein